MLSSSHLYKVRIFKMRVFIGVDFSQEIKDRLDTIKTKVQKNSLKGNYTLKENFHLTLQFIGDVNHNELLLLKKIVKNVVNEFGAFSIKAEGIGEFRRPQGNIVFVGVNKSQRLNEIYNLLNDELRKNGFTFENHSYTPHITLGRQVKYNREFNIKNLNFSPIEIDVNKVTLFESVRFNGVLTYIPILEVNLKY